MSVNRVNLISLVALFFLVAVVAITPESRQLMARLAFWIEGVEEKLEASRREREPAASPAAEEGRSAGDEGEQTSEPVQIPPHVVVGRGGLLRPAPGYSWINDDPADHRVEWVPGAAHPGHRGVIAAGEPGRWQPAAGYDWAGGKGAEEMRAVWTPGRRHPGYEHVLAAEKEGDWHPEPGYRWVNDDPNDLSVIPEEGAAPPS